MQPELPLTAAANIEHFTGRRWLLRPLLSWLEQPDGRLFILTGKPGTGKSMIAAWLAGAGPVPANLEERSQLERIRSQVKATHFCIAASGLNAPQAFAENMSEQLTRTVDGFGDALRTTLSDRVQIVVDQQADTVQPGGSVTGVYIGRLDLGALSDEVSFDRTLREPLKKLYEGGYEEPMLLVVDALDEALTYTGPINIVRLLAKLADLPEQIRILVTTRDDPRVLRNFRDVQPFDLILDAPAPVDDVHLYTYERLGGLDEERRTVLATRISQAAQGNFLYAYLVLGDLLPDLPDLPHSDSLPLPKSLSGLYHDFLNRELGGDRNEDRWYNTFRPLLGLVAVAQGEGLTRTQIERITGREMDQTLRACAQYFHGNLPEGPFRPFHRSFADFLLTDEENVDYQIDGTRMHGQVSDYYWTYSTNWRDCDPYGLRNLSIHLHLAAQYEKLFELANDRTWYETKLSLDPSGGAYSEDVVQAWVTAEELDAQQVQQGCLAAHLGREARYALATASLRSLSQGIPPALLSALVTSSRWSTTQALTAARLNPVSYRKVEALHVLVPLLPQELQQSVVQEGLAAAEEIMDPWLQAEARLALSAHMPEVDRDRAEREVLGNVLEIEAEWMRTDTLVAVASLVPNRLLDEMLAATWELQNKHNQEKVLVELAPRLPEDLLQEVLRIRPIEDVQCQPAMLAARVPFLPEPMRPTVLRQALDMVPMIEDAYWQGRALVALAPHLPERLLREAIEIAYSIDSLSGYRGAALAALAPCLAKAGDESAALTLLQDIWIPWQRAKALANLVTLLSNPQEALAAARTITDRYWKAEALSTLIPHLPESERSSLIDEALADRQIDDTDARAWALAALAAFLPEARRREALTAIRAISDDTWRAEALARLAPRMPEDVLEEAFEIAMRMDGERQEVRAVTALVPRLPERLLQRIMDGSWRLAEEHQAEVMVAMAPRLRDDLLEHALDAALNLGNPSYRSVTLAALAPHLPRALLSKALAAARSLEDGDYRAQVLAASVQRLPDAERQAVLIEAFNSVRSESGRKWVLAACALYLADEEEFEEVLDYVQLTKDAELRANVLVALAQRLPEALVPRALNLARGVADWVGMIRALAAFTPRLPEDPLREQVDAMQGLAQRPDSYVKNGIVPLLAHISGTERPALLTHALEATKDISGINGRVQALIALAPHLPTEMATQPFSRLYDVWCDTLHMAAEQSRKDLLYDLRSLAPIISTLGGVQAVAETFECVQELDEW